MVRLDSARSPSAQDEQRLAVRRLLTAVVVQFSGVRRRHVSRVVDKLVHETDRLAAKCLLPGRPVAVGRVGDVASDDGGPTWRLVKPDMRAPPDEAWVDFRKQDRAMAQQRQPMGALRVWGRFNQRSEGRRYIAQLWEGKAHAERGKLAEAAEGARVAAKVANAVVEVAAGQEDQNLAPGELFSCLRPGSRTHTVCGCGYDQSQISPRLQVCTRVY